MLGREPAPRSSEVGIILTIVVAAMLGFGTLSSARVDVDDGAPPNILLLLVDDIGVEQLDIYSVGLDTPPTPRLGALAAEGLVFNGAWSSPTCSPSRLGILTGRYAFRTGVGAAMRVKMDRGVPLESEVYLPSLLREVGYQSAAIGKWHLAPRADLPEDPFTRGFDHWDGTPTSLAEAPNDNYHFWAYHEDMKQFVDGYATTEVVDWAIDWIAEAEAQGGPWFAYVPFHAAHKPYQAPPPELHTQGECADDRECFQAMIEAVDTEMGRLLDSIGPVALAETIVIYAGDNGTECQVSFAPFDSDNCKTKVRQGGVWVPLVISGPGVAIGEVDAPVNLTDLFSTVLDLAGAAPPPGLVHDSVSLVPYFNDPGQASLREFAYTEVFRPNGFDDPWDFHRQVIRDERYALAYAFDGVRELYDLLTDPAGSVDLLADGASAEEREIGMALEQLRLELDPGPPF